MGRKWNRPSKDSNHAEVVDAAIKVGAQVVDIAAVKKAFDILVAYKGQLLCVEIKDGEKPASKRILTPGEIECKNRLESVGVPIYVINSTDEMIHLLNSI